MTASTTTTTTTGTTSTTTASSGAPPGTRITIRLPDDFHHHGRDGAKTAAIMSHVIPRFGRCLIMPNLKPPITTTDMALQYRQHIMDSVVLSLLSSLPVVDVAGSHEHDTDQQQAGRDFQPLMTLYLTDRTDPEEIQRAAAAGIVACKYYPAGATTNSDHGVTNIHNCYPALRAMELAGMVLSIHSEVTHGDIFDREYLFIDEIIRPLVQDFPLLRITMEHISTQEAVEYVLAAPDTVKASITCHHLLYNRNDMLVGGIRPHLYCLPILKGEIHRQALVRAATSGNAKFFLGTDSAPHATNTKETVCGCAGVFTAHAAIELYAEVFDHAMALDKLDDFGSSFGADHYGLPRSTEATTITLEKKPWTVPLRYDFGDGQTVTPLRAGEDIQWTLLTPEKN